MKIISIRQLKASTIAIFVIFPILYIYKQNISHYFQQQSDVINGTVTSDEPNVLANLRNFSFLINSDACATQEISVIIVVPSHPVHGNTRSALRSIYNRRIHGHAMKCVFLLGFIKNRTLQQEIETENEIHGDIVQGNFADEYHSIAYNHLQGLKWAINRCKKAPYVIKVDDDIFLNLPRLSEMIFEAKLTDKIFCKLWYHAAPVRDPKAKYYISEVEFPLKEFPTYCNGWVVVYPQQVAREIVHVSSRVPFLWMSDVFIAGICPKVAGIGFVDMSPRYKYKIKSLLEWYANGTTLPSFLAGPTGGNLTLLKMLHDKAWHFHSNKTNDILSSVST